MAKKILIFIAIAASLVLVKSIYSGGMNMRLDLGLGSRSDAVCSAGYAALKDSTGTAVRDDTGTIICCVE